MRKPNQGRFASGKTRKAKLKTGSPHRPLTHDVMLSVRVPGMMHKQLRAAADAASLTLSDHVRELFAIAILEGNSL